MREEKNRNKNKFLILFTIFIYLLSLNISFSERLEGVNFEFDGSKYNLDEKILKIYYLIDSDSNNEINSKFKINIYLNNSKLINSCEFDLRKDAGSKILKKVYCVAKINESGQYKYYITTDLDNNIKKIGEFEENIYLSNKGYLAKLNFFEISPNKTKLDLEIINLDENLENKDQLKVILKIPKEVINILNEENKDKLLKSNLNYEILEEDPVIAWNVENPQKITSNISKKISKEEQKQFEVNIVESKSFSYLKIIIILLIIVIIGLFLLPIFKKDTNRKGVKNKK